MSGINFDDLLASRYQLEQQPAQILDEYGQHAYEFMTGDNQSRKVVINIQPGDPDTIELAHFQIMWLQSLGVKQQNILLTIANPIIDASFPITNPVFGSDAITIESCTLDKLTVSDTGLQFIAALRQDGLIQEDEDNNLLTIKISYAWFVKNKDKLSAIIGKELVDSISEAKMLGNILGFIIPQILLMSRYEEDQKISEFINNKLTALQKKGLDACSFACYLSSKLTNLSSPAPTAILFLRNGQNRDQSARLFEAFYNEHFRGQQSIKYGKVLIDTILNRAVVNSKLSADFHGKYPDVQVISSGIYTEPISSATYKGVTAKALSGQVSTPEDKTKHNHIAPDTRRQLAVTAAIAELRSDNPDSTKMLDAFTISGLQELESFVHDPKTIVISGAPNTFYAVIMQSFVGDRKIDADLVRQFSDQYGRHLQILFAGTTDPNKFNLTGAGYNECADKFSALLDLMLDNFNLNVLTDLIKADPELLKVFNNSALAKDNDAEYITTTSTFTRDARNAYEANAPAFCSGIILLSVWLQKIAKESADEQEFAAKFKQFFEPVVFLTRDEYSKIKGPLSQYGYGDAKSLPNSVVAIPLADIPLGFNINGKIELMPKPKEWRAFLGNNKNAFKFALDQLKQLQIGSGTRPFGQYGI